jgi:tRNA A37 methylthiotransferase MiaB
LVGQKLKVLLEESTEDGELGGYSRNYVRVLTRGPASQLNRELEVEASFAKGARLVGKIVEVRETAASCAATTIL